jgi:hypothetical protein
MKRKEMKRAMLVAALIAVARSAGGCAGGTLGTGTKKVDVQHDSSGKSSSHDDDNSDKHKK